MKNAPTSWKQRPLHEKIAHQLDQLLMFQKVRDMGLFSADSNTQLNSTQLNSTQLNSTQLNSTQHACIYIYNKGKEAKSLTILPIL